MTVILEGVVGSIAYGLDTPESDQDMLGVFVAPTRDILGIHPVHETEVSKDPDSTRHEVGKFIRLALACNPTITELLWLSDYTTFTIPGSVIVSLRRSFLSDRLVRAAYGGYAKAQVSRLLKRIEIDGPDAGFNSDLRKRTKKHARHCARLLDQGRQLRETGHLTVKVSNRDELFEIGELAVKDPHELQRVFEKGFRALEDAHSVLPDQPDKEAINNMLLSIRESF